MQPSRLRPVSSTKPQLLALVSILGLVPVARAQDLSEPATDAPAPEVLVALDAALERNAREGGFADGFEDLFSAAALHDGTQERLLAHLERRVADFELAEAERRQLDWIRIDLLARRGDLRKARELCAALRDQLQEEQPVLAVSFRCARLLDAEGREKDATEAYEEALELAVTEGRRDIEEQIRLRRALFSLDAQGSDADPADALRDFASRDDADLEFRNRAANVLALTNEPAAALELSADAVGLSESKRFQLTLRRAEWALAAGQAEVAQEFAWEARSRANLARDRRYALTLLVEAHQLDKSLERLSDRLAAEAELDEESLGVWIEVLRRTGQVDRAVEVFTARSSALDPSTQRELVEIYREAGREEDMLATYRRLIAERPQSVEWRTGLARHYLENGDRATALEIFRDYIEDDARLPYFVTAAEAMASLGLDELAEETVDRCVEARSGEYPALLFLFDMHRRRGDLDRAVKALERIDEIAGPEEAVRVQMAESYERIGKADLAVEILEGLREARGGVGLVEDLEMRLAWLYSEVGREDDAFERWRELWLRVDSLPRRRYAEDRLMTVGSRLGRLADVVIELEKKLQEGTADERDAGLLVSLYTKVNDSVSATEVIEEQVRSSGGDTVDALTQQANVYLACTDYSSYEDTLRRLIEVDPANEPDYLRNLVMSMLERGQPADAKPVLERLKTLDRGADSAEFEAGVFALANLPEDAIRAYWRGIAAHPGRIEIYLLLGNLLRDQGETTRGVGMFQFLVETAERDDLFTIAVDGLLNLQAPPPTLRWARRITLERLARGGDRVYLFRLLADLSDELGDPDGAFDALEATLASAGTQRASILRELMERGVNQRDRERQLAYGRRLIGLGEVVPPQVYLDLGKAFLDDGDLTAARRTFGLASGLPDGARFQRDVAELFEDARYLEEALRIYRGVLVASTGDLELMAKVSELQEQVGDDPRAFALADRALELLLLREPILDNKESEDAPANSWLGNRNVNDVSTYYERLLKDLLATASEEELVALRDRQIETFRAELGEARASVDDDSEDAALESLSKAPRLRYRSSMIRRLLFETDAIGRAEEFDLELLEVFPEDEELFSQVVRYRIERGYFAAARQLWDRAQRPDEQKSALASAVGRGEPGSETRFSVGEVLQQLVPAIQADDRDKLARMVRRLDPAKVTSETEGQMPVVLAAATFSEDSDAYVGVARLWVQKLIGGGRNAYQIERILDSVAPFLDAGERSEFARSIAGSVLSDVEKSKNLMRLLPRLQKDVEQPLATPEELLELLDEQENVYAYSVVPVLQLLAAEDRPAALQSIWPKVAETQRASFLTSLLDAYEEPVGEDFAEFLVDRFKESLKDVPDYFWYSVASFGQRSKNPQIVLRFAELLAERKPEDFGVLFLRSKILNQLGQLTESLDFAAEALLSKLDAEQDYEWRSAVNQIANEFPSESRSVFLDLVAERADRSARSFLRRAQMLETFERLDEALALLDEAIEEHPEDIALRRERQQTYAAQGELLQSADELAEIVRLETDKKTRDRTRNQLVRLWLGQGNPVRALAASRLGLSDAETADADDEGDEEADDSEVDLARIPEPSIRSVAESVWDEDFDAARLRLRRFWRFGSALGNRFTFVNGSFVQQSYLSDPVWPEKPSEDAAGGEGEDPDAAASDPDGEGPPSVGGLVDFRRPEPEVVTEPREPAYEVLARMPFGRREIDRILRTLDATSVSQFGPLLEGLAASRVESLGTRDALVSVLDRIEAGLGGHLELGLLTAILEVDPALEPERVTALSSQLARTVEPQSGGAIQRLARLLAATGSEDAAARLYRWCAALAAAGASNDVQPAALIEDLREVFEGERAIELIDDVLRLSDPGAEPWEMESYETLVLRTWVEVLGPDQALERCRDLCEGLTDVREVLRRGPAKIAARLYSGIGEFDRAIELLEVGLCKLPVEGVTADSWYLSRYTAPGSVRLSELQEWFPEATDDETEAQRERRLDWAERAGSVFGDWIAAERVRKGTLHRGMLLIAVQLFEAGRRDAAMRIFDRARAIEPASNADRLWIADAARVLGQEAVASEIERDLLRSRSLHRGRIPGLLRDLAERDGAAAALSLGEQLVEWTLDEAILSTLIEIASDDPVRRERFEGLRSEAEAAQDALVETGVVEGPKASAAGPSMRLIRIR